MDQWPEIGPFSIACTPSMRRLLDVVARDDVELGWGQQGRLCFAIGENAADGGAPAGVDRSEAAFEPIGGAFDLALVEEERSEIDCGLCIVGSDRQRFAEAAFGFLNAAAVLLRVTEIVENFGGRRFLGRLREKVHSGVVVSGVEALQSCKGFVAGDMVSSAIAGGDRR
jgi:hypothetical protein